MLHFDWKMPLPLRFGYVENPQMCLARALPDDPNVPFLKPSFNNVFVRPTAPIFVILCPSYSV